MVGPLLPRATARVRIKARVVTATHVGKSTLARPAAIVGATTGIGAVCLVGAAACIRSATSIGIAALARARAPSLVKSGGLHPGNQLRQV